jgi:hypothetical protein
MINFGYLSLPLAGEDYVRAIRGEVSYDHEVSEKTYHPDFIDNKYYRINGPLDMCRYDNIIALKHIIESNNLSTRDVSIEDAIFRKQKFVYVLNFIVMFSAIENTDFLDRIPQYVVDAIIDNTCLLVLHYAHEIGNQQDSDFGHKILKLLHYKNIRSKNVLLLVNTAHNPKGDLGIDYKKYYQFVTDFKPIVWEFFETTSRIARPQLDLTIRHTDKTKLKKFVCLNRRNKIFRCIFVYQMYIRNIIDQFTVTFPNEHYYAMPHEIPEIPQDWYYQLNTAEYWNLQKTLPWKLDEDSAGWYAVETPPTVYNDNLICVVL